MLVLAELLYWNAALVIGTLGKVGRAACMGFPVEGKRKARSAVAGGLSGWKVPVPWWACLGK
ncbi:Cellulase M-related protein [Comamonas testosteroni TK102]|uniref:Cellulase M-related protein n=1 Tax=Comamonas testosteroni TK102 TaxID=1392005 RepID=A0A076PNE1_COMTE|nr:Cellulase M-related protein [Comamonas testosteroni TK102]